MFRFLSTIGLVGVLLALLPYHDRTVQGGEPLTKSELIRAWQERVDQYPNLHVQWKSSFTVNLATMPVSPFETEVEETQSGIRHLDSSATDEAWFRGPIDRKIVFSELNVHDGDYSIFRKEKNVVQGVCRTRIDELAQGTIQENAKQLGLDDRAYMVLELNYRPLTSKLHEQLQSGAAQVLPDTNPWAGVAATVVSVPLSADMVLEYYFDGSRRGHFVGYSQITPKSESRLEVVLNTAEGGKYIYVSSATYDDTVRPDGQLDYACYYKGYSFRHPNRISGDELAVSFDPGFLVTTSDAGEASPKYRDHVVGSNGELLKMNSDRRSLLDSRVHQPHDSGHPLWLVVALSITGIVVVCFLIYKKFR